MTETDREEISREIGAEVMTLPRASVQARPRPDMRRDCETPDTCARGGSMTEPPLAGGHWRPAQVAGGVSTVSITKTVAFLVGMLPHSTL